MTINRRTFLGATAGLGIWSLAGIRRARPVAGLATGGRAAGPMPDEYEQILARTTDLKHLGRPRSWSVVQQVFLPVAPERVLILAPEYRPWHRNPGDSWAYEHRSLRRRLGTKLAVKGMPLPDEKVALCVRIAFELGRFYNAPEHGEDWAYRMACRESFGSTGLGGHIAIPHQYQAVGRVATSNANVDWWLILIPQGTYHWHSWDDLPVHLMLTCVFSTPIRERPDDEVQSLCLLSRGLRTVRGEPPEFALSVARMDRTSAARLVNRHVVLAMQEKA